MSTAFTPEEVASELKVSRSQVYRLIRDGQLRPIRDLRPFRISRFELDRFASETEEEHGEASRDDSPATVAATAWAEAPLSLVGRRR